MKVGKSQKGATLLELIVALVVIGITVAGFSTVIETSLDIIDKLHSHEENLYGYRCCAETMINEYKDGVSNCNNINTEACDDCGDYSLQVDSNTGYCEIEIGRLVIRLNNP